MAAARPLDIALALAARVHAGQCDASGEPRILAILQAMLASEGETERIGVLLGSAVAEGLLSLDDIAAAGLDGTAMAALRAALARPAGLIVQCGIGRMPGAARQWRPGRVLSLVDPGVTPPRVAGMAAGHHLTLAFDDIEAPPGAVPEPHHLAALLDFAAAWDGTAPLLVHCMAGISRSGAAVFILLCQANPGREAEAAALLRRRAPHLLPNRRMVALADALLGCGGRMVALAADWPVDMMPEDRPPACVIPLRLPAQAPP